MNTLKVVLLGLCVLSTAAVGQDWVITDADSSVVAKRMQTVAESDIESRPYFLFFTRFGCSACIRMKDEQLDTILQAGYRVLLLDSDHEDKWVKKYKVELLPTFVLLDAKTRKQIGDKWVGYTDAQTLLKAAREATPVSTQNSTNTTQPPAQTAAQKATEPKIIVSQPQMSSAEQAAYRHLQTEHGVASPPSDLMGMEQLHDSLHGFNAHFPNQRSYSSPMIYNSTPMFRTSRPMRYQFRGNCPNGNCPR